MPHTSGEITLSVIVPVKNYEQFIDDCLLSVLSTGAPDVEVIVIDDGSTDGSASRVQALFDKYGSRSVKLLRVSGGGVSAARNKGIAAARGRYLAFLDADDRWITKTFVRFIDFALKSDVDFAFAGWVSFDGETENVLREVSVKPFSPDDLTASLLKAMPIISSVICRNFGIRFDEALSTSEVLKYWLEVLLDSAQIAYFDEPVCAVRRHTSVNRITNQFDHWEPLHRLKIYSESRQNFETSGRMTPLLRAAFDQKITQLAFRCALLRNDEWSQYLNIDRRQFPRYFWWKWNGLSGLVFFFGPHLGFRIGRFITRLKDAFVS